MHQWEETLNMLEKKLMGLRMDESKLTHEERKDLHVFRDKKAHQQARAKKLALRTAPKPKIKKKDMKPEKGPKTRGPKRRQEEE